MTLLSKPIRFKHKIWAEDTHNIKNITKLLEEMQNMFSQALSYLGGWIIVLFPKVLKASAGNEAPWLNPKSFLFPQAL